MLGCKNRVAFNFSVCCKTIRHFQQPVLWIHINFKPARNLNLVSIFGAICLHKKKLFQILPFFHYSVKYLLCPNGFKISRIFISYFAKFTIKIHEISIEGNLIFFFNLRTFLKHISNFVDKFCEMRNISKFRRRKIQNYAK